MVTVVSGAGLGLFGSSISNLGAAGAAGNSALGRGTDRVYVNTATGNLVVQSRDESLSALGLDLALVRTYNSQGLLNDDNGDNWRLGVHQRVYQLTGTVNTAGSTITKVFGDGREVVYSYNTGLGLYVSNEGEGAHDTLSYNSSAAQWNWTEGSNRHAETYNDLGQLLESRDADGNTVTYSYTGGLLTQIADASGQTTFLDYSGNNLAQIRVVSDGQTQTLTRYTYDGSNRLTEVRVDLSPADNSITDNQVYTTTYTYDGTSRRVASITQSDGSSVSFTYENIGGQFRVRTYTDAENRVTTLTYSEPSGSGSGPVQAPADPAELSTTQIQSYPLITSALTYPSPWSAATLLESSGTAASDPQLAFDENGNGFAVSTQGSDVWVRRYTGATQTWSTAVALDTESTTAYAPALAVDDAGNAVVAWVQSDGVANSVYATHFDVTTQTWRTVEALDDSDGAVDTTAGTVSVSVNGTLAAVAWVQTAGAQQNLYTSVYDIGQWWGPDLVDTGTSEVSRRSIAIDANIRSTLVWRQSDGTAESIYTARYSNTSFTWGTPMLLESSATPAGDPKVVFDEDGNGVAIWSQGADLIARRYSAATDTWSTAATLDTGSATVASPSLSIDPATGNAIAAWVQSDGTAESVYVSRYSAATNQWSTAALLETSSQAVLTAAGSVVTAIRGNYAAVAWVQNDGSATNLHGSRWNGSAWSGAYLVETGANAAGQPSLAIDAQGNAAVVWQQSDGTANSIYTARYVGTSDPPYYTIPSGATWQSLANTLYGVNSAAAGTALQTALGNPTLTTGAPLTGMPATLNVQTTVSAYYTVQSGDTWASITQTVYGTSDVNAIAALQTELGNPTLTVGSALTVPSSLTYVPSGTYNAHIDPDEVSTSDTQGYNLNTGALATSSWAAVALLESSAIGASDPRVAFDDDGDGFAVWAQGGDVFVRRYTASTQTWSSAVALDTGSATVHAPALAVDGAGNAVVAWVQSDGVSSSLYATHFDATTQAWSTVEALEDSDEAVDTTVGSVAASVNGTLAAVAWVQTAGAQQNLYASVYDVGQWFGPDLVDGSSNAVSRSSIAIDADINATMVWRQSDGTAESIYASRYSNTTFTWGTQALLENSTTPAGDPKVVFDEDGNGIAIWSQGADLIARRYTAATDTWAIAVTLDTGSATVAAQSLSIDAATGNAIAAWVQSDGTAESVYVSRYSASTNQWSTAALLESAPQAVLSDTGSVLTAIRGNYAAVAWVQNDGSVTNLYGSRWNGSAWDGAQLIETGTNSATAPSIAIDAAGNAAVVWQQSDGTASSIYTARYVGTSGAPYYTIPNGATWQSIANTLYGVNSAAAGAALQAALSNPTLAAGIQLTGMPATLNVTTTVPAYYTVETGDTWASITQTVYGTSDANAITALQTALGNPTLTVGTRLTVPVTLNYTGTSSGGGGAALYLETDVEDALGFVTTYTHDSAGRLTAVLSPTVNGSRLETRYTYDADGNVTSIAEDPMGLNRVTTFGYDTNGNLLSTRDSLGNTVTRTYDADNQMLTEVRYVVPDPDGAGSGQPSVSLTTRYAYDAENHLRFVISAQGRVTEHRYNTAGERVLTLDYTGALYTASGFTESELATWAGTQDLTRLERTEYGYDFRGNLAALTSYRTTNAAGAGTGTASITRFVYDQRGQLLQSIDARGSANTPDPETPNLPYATTYVYDGLGRVLSTTQWISGTSLTTTLNSYDDANRRTTTTFANGLVTTQTYNGAGELISTANGVAGALGTTTYAYDAGGRLRIVTDPTGIQQFHLYDAAGRQIAQVDGDGSLVEFVYDDVSQLVKTVRYAVRLDATTLGLLEDIESDPPPVTIAALRTAAGGNPNADRITRTVYDTAGRVVYEIDEIGAVTEFRYDGAGRVTDEVRYATAVTIASTVDQVLPSELTLTPAASDRRTRHFYDADGLLRGTLDAAGYLVELEYDAQGRLVRQIAYATATNPAERDEGTLDELRPALDNETALTPERDIVSHFFYDGQGDRIGVLDAEGFLTRSLYDVSGRLVEQTRYDQQLTFSAGISVDDLVALVGASTVRHTTLYAYDGAGRVIEERSVRGTSAASSEIVTTFGYDEVGNLTAVTRAQGTAEARATATRYDALGRVVQELTAEGQALIAAGGLSQAQIDEIWSRYGIRYEYDLAGRRISATMRPNDAQTNTTLYFYDNDGRLRFEVNSLGEVKENRYDALGNLAETLAYRTPISTADLVGGLVSALLTDRVPAAANTATDARTVFTHTRRGQLAASTSAELASTSHTYNAFGEETARAQQLSATDVLEHEYEYDARGLLTLTRWDPAGINTTEVVQYDAFGRVTQITDANGNERRLEYDRLGRTIVTVDALQAERSTTYDAFSRVLTATDALGNETVYAYDDVNRAMTVTTPEGIAVTTVLNRHGQTLSVTAAGNLTQYTYDLNGRLTGTSDSLGTLESRTYDRAGRQLTSTDGRGATTTFSYDAANRVLTRVVDSVTGGQALTTSYAYDGQGRVATVTDPNGIITQTTYDRDGRVIEVAVDPGDLNIRTTYEYDRGGRLITVTEGAGSANPRETVYDYDDLGRRTQEIVDPEGLALTTEYVYDGNGNLARKRDARNFETLYVYDAENRLRFVVDAEWGTTETTYDANGRVAAQIRYSGRLVEEPPLTGPLTIEWVQQAEREYTTAPPPPNRIEQCLYDDDGRHVFTIDAMGGVTRKEYDANGNVVRQVMYSQRIATGTYSSVAQVETALALVDDSNTANDRESRTVYDLRGRARYAIDGLGGVIAHRYDANGNVIATTAFATAFIGGGLPPLATLDAWATSEATNQDRTTRMWYDAANRLRFTLDAEGYLHERRYDDVGRQTAEILYDARPTAPASNATTADLEAAALAIANSVQDQSTDTLFDAAGRATRVTDARGEFDSYTYDAVGNRLTFTNRNGATWTYVYDANRRMIEEISPEVSITTVDYINGNNGGYAGYDTDLASSTTTGTLITRIGYDALGNVSSRTEAYGRSNERTTTYSYDALGRQIGVRLPEVYRYGDGDSISTVTPFESVYRENFAPRGQGESFVGYDTFGNARSNSDAAANSTQRVYDELGRVRFQIDSELYVTEYRYDTFGNQIELIRYAAALDEQQYFGQMLDIAGVQALLTPNAGADRVLLTEYDRLNRAVRVIEPETMAFLPNTSAPGGQVIIASPTTVTEYNAHGQVVRQSRLVDPTTGAVASTYNYYDELGRMTAQVDALGHLTTFEYDAAGNMIGRTEYVQPLGTWDVASFGTPAPTTRFNLPDNPGGYDRVTEWEYDQLNRRVTERLVDFAHATVSGGAANSAFADRVTTFGYDAVGNQTRVTDPTGASTYTYHDALGRQIAIAAPTRDRGDGTFLTPLVRMGRDAFGNLVDQTTHALGATEADEEGFDFDTAAGDQRTLMLVDALNRVIQTMDGTGAKRFAIYNRRGDLSAEWQELTDPVTQETGNQATVYEHDRLGRRTATVEATRREAAESFGGGALSLITTAATYNAFGEVTTKTVDQDGLGAGTETYEYDQAGRLWRTNDGDGVYRIYLHDLAGRVTAEIRSRELSLDTLNATQAEDLTAQRMRTETRYDLLGRIVEQRLPEFTPTNPDSDLEVIGASFRIDNILGPNNPDAVFQLITETIDFGFGEHVISRVIRNAAASLLQGGGYSFVRPTPGNPGGFVRDPNYQLVTNRYMHWTAPEDYSAIYGAESPTVTFEYRAAGNPSGGWTSLDVVTLPRAEIGVDLDALASGEYEYRVTYARANQVAPYAIATGTMTLDATSASTTDTTLQTLAAQNITPTYISTEVQINDQFRDADFRIGGFSGMSPVDEFVYRRVVSGSLVSYIVDRRATVAQGGGYYLTASGYVQDTSYQPATSLNIRWDAPSQTGLVATFEYWSAAEGEWQELTATSINGGTEYSVAVGDLADGYYEYRAIYRSAANPNDPPVATATGNFTIESAGGAQDLELTPDPADNAGTVAPIGNRPPTSNDIETEITASAGFTGVSGGGLTFSGDNQVLVTFPPITGAVRIEIEYLTRAVAPEDHPGPGGTGWPSQQRRISLLVTDASAADEGLQLTWRDPTAPSTGGGVSTITRVRVYAVDSEDQATLRYASDNTDASTIGGTTLSWDAPWNTGVVATFRVRPAGTTTWQTMTVTRTGGDFSVDVQSLASGAWEYEVTYTQNSVVRATSTGTFVTSGGSIANVLEDPGSGPPPVESVAPVAGMVTSPVEFTIEENSEQIVTGPSYEIVNGQMVQHRPLETEWDGENEVALTWANLGTNPVRVTIDYTSAPRYGYNYSSADPPRWEEDASYVPGVRTSRTQDFSSGATGATLNWSDADGDIGGIATIHRIRIYTQVSGNWVLTYERDAAAPTGGTSLYWPAPDNEAVDSEFRVRQVGTTTWQTITVDSSDNGLLFVDLDALAAGNYEYQIRYSITESSVTTFTALTSGTFTVSEPAGGTPQSRPLAVTQNNVAYDRGASDFGPVAWDGAEVSWSFAPQSGDTITLRTRPAGTTTWQDQTINGSGPDYEAAATAATGQAIEFEIHYTSSGQSVPYAISRGTLNRSVAVTRTPPIANITQTATFQSSIAPVADVDNMLGELTWSTPRQTGSTVTFRYQLANGTWQTLTPVEDEDGGFRVNQTVLPPGSYRYEIIYAFSGQIPYAFASGLMSIDDGTAGGDVTIEDTTRYVDSIREATNPEVPRTTQTWDRWGNVLSVTDRAGNTTDYRYDQLGGLVELRQPEVEIVSTTGGTVAQTVNARPITRNHYDIAGRLIGTTDANLNVNAVSYNAGGQRVSETHADGGEKSYVYDAFGNQVLITDEEGFRTRNTYDVLNRLTSVEREISIGGLGSSTESITYEYGYDDAGRRISETDGAGNITRYRYDLQDNLIARITPRGFETLYEYDYAGRKNFERDANGFEATWTYDAFGRLLSHTDFGGGITLYEYDNAGLLLRQTSTRGQNLTYNYDSAGQLTRIVDAGVVQPFSGAVNSFRLTDYGYDIAGRRIWERTIVNNQVHQDSRITYDALGRMTGVTDPDFDLAYSYDAAGNRTLISGTYADHTGTTVPQNLWYTYDEMNRVLVSQGEIANGIIDATALQGIRLTYNLKGERIGAFTFGEHFRIDQTFESGGPEPGPVLNYIKQGGLFTERYGYDGLGRLIWTEQDTVMTIEPPSGPPNSSVVSLRTNTRAYDRASREILDESYTIEGTSAGALNLNARTSAYDLDGRMTVQEMYKDAVLQFRVRYGDGVFTPPRIVPVSSLAVREYVTHVRNVLSPAGSGSGSGSGSSRGRTLVTLQVQTWRDRGRLGGSSDLPEGFARIPAHFTGRGFDRAGMLHSYTVDVHRPSDGKYLYSTDYTLKYRVDDSYKLISESTNSWTPVHNITLPGRGYTTRTYNVNGELVQFSDSRDSAKNRYFVNNAQGQALTVIQGRFDGDDGRMNPHQAFDVAVERTGNEVKGQYFFFANGQSLGSFGQLQGEGEEFEANFDINFTRISESYPATVPGQVVVQRDDTLRTIAGRVYGDASLWYLIAEENGLSDPNAVLEEGVLLRIPNAVANLSNTAYSFKPFDVRDAIGDTTPTQPIPKPKKMSGLRRFLSTLLVVVVVIVVAWWTGGASAGLVQTLLSAAAANAAGQGVAIATGLQDEFSWKSLGASVLTAGILQGTPIGNIGANASSLNPFGQAFVQGAVNSVVNQGVNIALGLQDSFSWEEVAISAVSTATSGEVGRWVEGQMPGASPRVVDLASNSAAAATSVLMRTAFGGRVDTTSVLADVFGNAIGNSIVDGMTPQPVTRSEGISITDEQWAEADQLLSAQIAAGQGQFNDQLQRDLRQQQFQLSLQREITRSLDNNPEPTVNLPVPTAEFVSRSAPAISRQEGLDRDLMEYAIAGGIGTSSFNRPIERAFDAQLIEALTPKPGIDPRTGLRAGPTHENAIALGLEPRFDPYSHSGAELWPWDGKLAGGNPLGLDGVRAGSWHYRQAANLSSALPALPAAGGYSLGARFVAGQLAKQPLTQLGTVELLKGMGASGSVSTILYLGINQEESTPAGVAVAFGSGAVGGGLTKQSLNYWAALPNTAIPVSWSNAVTQAVGAAYGFSTFGVWNASGTTATGDSWWTRPIIAPTLPEQSQSK